VKHLQNQTPEVEWLARKSLPQGKSFTYITSAFLDISLGACQLELISTSLTASSIVNTE